MSRPIILMFIGNDEVHQRVMDALWEELGEHVQYTRIITPPRGDGFIPLVWHTPIVGLDAVLYVQHQDKKTRNGLEKYVRRLLDDLYSHKAWPEVCTRLGAGYTLSR